jgi:hypothetical protein
VRQAISLAIDRDAAIARLKESAARRAPMMPVGHGGSRRTSCRFGSCLVRPIWSRRALLRAAGVERRASSHRVDVKSLPSSSGGVARIRIILRLTWRTCVASRSSNAATDISPRPVAIGVDDPTRRFPIATSGAVQLVGVTDARLDALREAVADAGLTTSPAGGAGAAALSRCTRWPWSYLSLTIARTGG